MPNTKIKELEAVVAKLHQERQGHLQAIEEIDAAFEQLGIDAGSLASVPVRRGPGRPPKRGPGRPPKRGPGRPPKRGPGRPPKRGPGRPPKAASGRGAGRRKKRGHRFPVSGTTSILEFVKQAGEKGVTGKQIDQHWKSEGRKGSAYNILGQLVRDKQIKRQNLKGQRGSMYTA
jgi:hypothetical protein